MKIHTDEIKAITQVTNALYNLQSHARDFERQTIIDNIRIIDDFVRRCKNQAHPATNRGSVWVCNSHCIGWLEQTQWRYDVFPGKLLAVAEDNGKIVRLHTPSLKDDHIIIAKETFLNQFDFVDYDFMKTNMYMGY